MRILVAMSGGVDSSVVAARLLEEGHEVVGATLQLYDSRGAAKKGACCAGQDIRDARAVADLLGFPHYVIDAERRFKDSVIERFADAYASGETPVPCVACNQGVKFTDLLGLAREIGADAWQQAITFAVWKGQMVLNCTARVMKTGIRAGSCLLPRGIS